MIIKFSLIRLTIIFLLVILFPLVQNQWLNLYLFDINNFTIYKLLYYLSGLICPVLVFKNSLNKFTYYKFLNNKIKSHYKISGKSLFLITLTILLLLSFVILNYFFINLKIFSNLLITDNKYITYLHFDKQILFAFIISILLIFKKTILVMKKILLINFFIISCFIWYIQINNIQMNYSLFNMNIFKLENISFINILFLLFVEILYYLWSYISYSTYLSDWRVPILYKNEITPILKIIVFYLFIILYYSILFT